MDVQLHQWSVPGVLELVHFTGLDDEDVSGLAFELLAVDLPETAALAHELHFVVGVSMRSGPGAWPGIEEKDRDVDVAVVGSDEVMRASLERQVLLADSIHVAFHVVQLRRPTWSIGTQAS